MTIDEKIDQLVTDVAVIKNELKRFPKSFSCVDHKSTFEDHEKRIRILEDHKSKIAGSLIAISALGSFIGVVVGLVIAFISK